MRNNPFVCRLAALSAVLVVAGCADSPPATPAERVAKRAADSVWLNQWLQQSGGRVSGTASSEMFARLANGSLPGHPQPTMSATPAEHLRRGAGASAATGGAPRPWQVVRVDTTGAETPDGLLDQMMDRLPPSRRIPASWGPLTSVVPDPRTPEHAWLTFTDAKGRIRIVRLAPGTAWVAPAGDSARHTWRPLRYHLIDRDSGR